MKKQKEKNGQKGITLIALIITIIVLIILAGISIMMISGQDGILQRAGRTTEVQGKAQVSEAMSLIYNEYIIEQKTNGNTEDFIDYVKATGKVNDSGVIDTKKLTGGKIALGNGKDNKDVYKLEKVENGYAVYYYGKTSDESGKLIWNSEGSVANDKIEIKTALNTYIAYYNENPYIMADIYDNYDFTEKEKILGGKEYLEKNYELLKKWKNGETLTEYPTIEFYRPVSDSYEGFVNQIYNYTYNYVGTCDDKIPLTGKRIWEIELGKKERSIGDITIEQKELFIDSFYDTDTKANYDALTEEEKEQVTYEEFVNGEFDYIMENDLNNKTPLLKVTLEDENGNVLGVMFDQLKYGNIMIPVKNEGIYKVKIESLDKEKSIYYEKNIEYKKSGYYMDLDSYLNVSHIYNENDEDSKEEINKIYKIINGVEEELEGYTRPGYVDTNGEDITCEIKIEMNYGSIIKYLKTLAIAPPM